MLKAVAGGAAEALPKRCTVSKSARFQYEMQTKGETVITAQRGNNANA